jgi:hypothetical protein
MSPAKGRLGFEYHKVKGEIKVGVSYQSESSDNQPTINSYGMGMGMGMCV